jgi:phage terminase large subunit GpA-like protein
MGTQMGKSATMQNVMGWKTDDEPAPIIYIGPTESNINNVVEPKVVDMFREAKGLSVKFDHKSPKHKKRIAGVSIRFAWAGSATELASDSAVITLVDELDRPPENATGEGDLVEIAEARGDAYADSKLGLTSTPTHGTVVTYVHPETGLTHWADPEEKKVSSPIWLQFVQGTKHEWAVPHLDKDCGQYFIPRSDLLTWKGKGTDEDVTPGEVSKSARLICPHCGGLIEDKDRQQMNALGIAVAPGQKPLKVENDIAYIEQGGQVFEMPYGHALAPDENQHFSIWISGLCSFSLKKSYGYLARKLFLALKGANPATLLSVYNTGFGEIFAVAGEAPTWHEVYEKRSDYMSGSVPEDCKKLILTLDVQINRLVFVVRAWGESMTSYKVQSGELWGDTDKPEIWADLDDFITQEWQGYSLNLVLIDCGYRQVEVLEWVRRNKGLARAVMGFEKIGRPYRLTKLEVDTKSGKTRKSGDQRWDFDTGMAKSWVHSRVRWNRGAVGDWSLPADVTEDYCKQIVAEEFDEETGKWRKTARDNHFLDCEAMQYIGARMLKLDRYRKTRKTKKSSVESAEDSAAEDDQQTDDDALENESEKKPKTKRKAKSIKTWKSRKKKRNYAQSW